MTPEQKAAYIYSQAVCALAEIQGMVAANMTAAIDGVPLHYGEGDFTDVPMRYGISHNAVTAFLRD